MMPDGWYYSRESVASCHEYYVLNIWEEKGVKEGCSHLQDRSTASALDSRVTPTGAFGCCYSVVNVEMPCEEVRTLPASENRRLARQACNSCSSLVVARPIRLNQLRNCISGVRSFLPQLSLFGYKASRLNGLEGKNGWASFLMLALCQPQ